MRNHSLATPLPCDAAGRQGWGPGPGRPLAGMEVEFANGTGRTWSQRATGQRRTLVDVHAQPHSCLQEPPGGGRRLADMDFVFTSETATVLEPRDGPRSFTPVRFGLFP